MRIESVKLINFQWLALASERVATGCDLSQMLFMRDAYTGSDNASPQRQGWPQETTTGS